MLSSVNISQPRVSFLLCTHVSGDLLFESINSCLSQTIDDFEIVIITNGPDALQIYLELSSLYIFDCRFRIFYTPVNGLTFSLSYGAHLCRSPYIARIDSDDINYNDRLEQQLIFLQKNPHIDVVGTQFVSSLNPITSNLPCSHISIKLFLYFANPICHPTVLLRRDLLLANSGYNGACYVEDYDLWVRLMLKGCVRFANLPNPYLTYHDTGVGPARGNIVAYCGMASIQIRAFLLTFNPFWFLGFLFTTLKILFINLKRFLSHLSILFHQ